MASNRIPLRLGVLPTTKKLPSYRWIAGDTALLPFSFLNPDGTVYNCVGVTFRFYLRAIGAAGNLVNGSLLAAVDVAAGEYSYAWTDAQVGTPGYYHGEVRATGPDGKLITTEPFVLEIQSREASSSAAVLSIAAVSVYNLEWEGAWALTTAYAGTDESRSVVLHNSVLYVGTATHTSTADTEPGVGVDWATVWDVFLPQGPTGATGASPPGLIWLSAAGMWPSITAGCAYNTRIEMATNRQNFYVLDFDQTTQEHAECNLKMPTDWDGGVLYARFHWTANDATADAVRWALQGRAYGDGEALDQAWGTAVAVTDENAGAAYRLRISAQSAAITLAGTPTASEQTHFRVYRDITVASNMAADARLIGVMIYYTRTA